MTSGRHRQATMVALFLFDTVFAINGNTSSANADHADFFLSLVDPFCSINADRTALRVALRHWPLLPLKRPSRRSTLHDPLSKTACPSRYLGPLGIPCR